MRPKWQALAPLMIAESLEHIEVAAELLNITFDVA
jgi:hypothetical protein